MNLLKKYFRTSVIAVILAFTTLFAILLPIVTVNAVSAQIEIISIEETSGRSVEITFNSRIMKKQISYFTITASPDLSGITQSGNSSLQQNKQISKKLNRKATGLIIYEFKPIPTAVPYTFKVCAKSFTGKTICSDSLKHPQFADLFEQISRLPSDWGNPKPIQLPVTSPAPVPAILSAPAFTLTSSTESRTVNTTATGFTINSTGGAIASFAINATPPGMSFNTTTGALSGTPNTVAAATTYTVTATNASGSTAQTFTLTVLTAIRAIGSTGPGGGKVFYYSAAGFTCGPTLASTCNYLEAAPSSGVNASPITSHTYGCNGLPTTDTAIGTGYKNTLTIEACSNAGTIARAYRGPNNLTDWYLPSQDEMFQMYTNIGNDGSFTTATPSGDYWTSTNRNNASAWAQFFLTGEQNFRNKLVDLYVRPARAF
jgi:hypothetical protein